MTMKNKFWPVLLSILTAQSAGLLGSIFTTSSIPTWYINIIKPEWNPPSWIFGPVWITLYTLMGIAAYLIWKNKNTSRHALTLYGIQLLLNALWSILFFGLKNPGLAFAEIIVLWVFIVGTLISFWKIDKRAGALLLPYLAWVSFAVFLNYTIWQLN